MAPRFYHRAALARRRVAMARTAEVRLEVRMMTWIAPWRCPVLSRSADRTLPGKLQDGPSVSVVFAGHCRATPTCLLKHGRKAIRPRCRRYVGIGWRLHALRPLLLVRLPAGSHRVTRNCRPCLRFLKTHQQDRIANRKNPPY